MTSSEVHYVQDEEAGGYFPFGYFVHFLEFLRAHDDVVEFITYDDLPWGDDYDSAKGFPQERKKWLGQLKDGQRDPRKIYVLIQHDVDSVPERTMDLVRQEHRLEIPTNLMIFTRRISRQHLRETGELLYTKYDLDYGYLRRLQDELGLVLGYHSNALDRALFDVEKALEIFEADVAALRRHFNVRYFSPHGGARGPNGECNNQLPVPEALVRSLRWIANRRTVRFDGDFSDGGINSPRRNPAKRDLRDFVAKWKPGKRYRVLAHPQYYHTPWQISPRMGGTPWYDELLAFYAAGGKGTSWDHVRIG